MWKQFQGKEMTLPILDAKIERTLIHLNGRLDKCAYALQTQLFFHIQGRFTQKFAVEKISLKSPLNPKRFLTANFEAFKL